MAPEKDDEFGSKWVDLDRIRVRKRRPPAPIMGPTEPEDIETQRRGALHFYLGCRQTGKAEKWRGGAERFGPVDCVYFVRLDATDAYKIGYTHNLRGRLSAIQAGIPAPVKCWGWISFFNSDVLGEAEARAHELASLYGAHIRGEWFNLRERDIRKIIDDIAEGMSDEVMGISYTGAIK